MSEERDFDFPWFPLYHEKFTNSPKVRMMTPEQVGVYIILLCHQWDVGPFSDSVEELALLCNRADVNTVGTVLERCFNGVDGVWANERLEEIRERQVEKRMAKVRAGRASAKARRKSKRVNKKEHRSNTAPTPLEHRTNNKEEEVEEEEDSLTTPTAAAVGIFLDRTGSEWRLDATIPEWVREIQKEPKYAGVDYRYEIMKCTDWHVGRGKKPKAPDISIRNWLENAAEDVKRGENGKRPYSGPTYDALN